MAVKINYGKEEIDVKNAAEEETLRRLLGVMEKAFGKSSGSYNAKHISDVNKQTKRAATGIDDLADVTDDAKGGLGALSAASDGATRDLKEFGRDLRDSVSDIKRGFADADPAAMLKGIADGLKTGLEGIGGVVGSAIGGPIGAKVGEMVGSAIGGVGVALAAVAGAIAGEVNGLTKNFQEMSSAGLVAGDGVTTFSRTIIESGTTLGQFIDTVKRNSSELAAMGGSVTQGSKQFLNMRKSLRNYEEDFTRLGYSYQEMNDVLADYSSSIAKGYGSNNLSNAQIAKQTADYAKNLRIVSDITGKNAKELKEQNSQLHNSAMAAGALQDLADKFGPQIKDQYDSVGSAVDMLGPTAKKLYEEYMGMGQAVTKSTALLETQAPTQAAAVRELVEKLKSGGFESAEAQKQAILRITELSKTDAAKAEQRNMLQLAQVSVLGQGNAVLADLTQNAGQVNEQMGNLAKTNVEEVITNITKALDRAGKDEGTQAMVQMQQAQQKLLLAQNSVSISMVNLAGVQVAKSLNFVADAALGAAEAFRIRSTPEAEAGRGVSIGERALAATEDIATVIPRAFGGVAEDIAGIFGVERGWAIDPTTRDSMTPYYDELRAREYNEGSNLTAPPEGQWNDYERRMTDMQRANDEMTTQLEDQNAQLRRSIEDSQRAMQDLQIPGADQGPAPAQATGNIFGYKPGGHKVTVAELSDEIVAPAKRGSDGKLGLEVTGVMLDNSKLLQSLVKINESQAGLIAGLNSRIEGMTASVDKLVDGQRQANRLAI